MDSYLQLNTEYLRYQLYGAFKVLARVIKDYCKILSPLENFAAGKSSSDNIVLSEELHAAFINARDSVSYSKSITIPRLCDQLWIVTDGAVKEPGIGATLYITRKNSKHLLAEFPVLS